MDENNLLRFIYGKYNELDSLRKYTSKDDVMFKIINAKIETLSDIKKMINSRITMKMIFD